MQMKLEDIVQEISVLIEDTLSDIASAEDFGTPQEDVERLRLEVTELRSVEAKLRNIMATTNNGNIQ